MKKPASTAKQMEERKKERRKNKRTNKPTACNIL
jgi:hypothetical protein